MLISTPIPDDASITMTRAAYLEARADAVKVALPDYDGLTQKIADLERTIALQKAQLEEALAEIKRLEALIPAPVALPDTQPVPVPVVELPPVVVPVALLPPPRFQPTVENLYGIFISDDHASGPKRDAWLNDVIDFIAAAGVFNAVFMYANIYELRDWSKVDNSPAHRLRYNKLTWVFDTWNAVPDGGREETLFKAMTLHAAAFQIDDAQRWLSEPVLNDFRAMVDAVFQATKMPALASYGGKSPISAHAGLPVIPARQAYINGESPAAVKAMLPDGTGIANLGVYRDEASPMTTVQEVRGAFEAFSATACRGVVWYGFDANTDLRKYPGQWGAVVDCGKQYWRARGIDR